MNNNENLQNQNVQPNIQPQVNVTETVKYASFGKRLCAFFIDSLLVWIVILIPSLIFWVLDGGRTLENYVVSSIVLCFAVLFLPIGYLYSLFADASKKHRTLGMRCMHICVKDKYGNYLTFRTSFIRFILRCIFCEFFGITIFTIWVTEKKQGLYDLVTGQVVVEEN